MLQCEDIKGDDEGTCNTLEHFTEYEQVLQLIDSIKEIDATGFEKDYELFNEILSRYQEQPHLLDPHLEELLQRLLSKVRSASSTDNVKHAAFKYLYIICKVRTYKTLVKFLPHELTDLEFALELLERQDPKDHLNWETRYMLILWMSILVMNPFHLARLDAYETNIPNGGDNIITDNMQRKTKMERIFDLCKVYTSSNDTCSNIAAYLSAKYFVRSDIKDLYLEQFLDWIISQHNHETEAVKFGQLAAVSAILKHGKREDLLPYAHKLLSWIVSCQYKDNANLLKYKSYIKIIQRIGLVFLKPRVAQWRYKRGTRSLATNLTQAQNSLNTQQTVGDNMEVGVAVETEEEVEVPDAIDEVIEELLQALRSDGSDIRWNAAKGIGRVTNRLPKEIADEVIGCVIDILSPLEPHDSWHGGCLALAELAKRGLLLPHRLCELVPLLLQALFYDEMKGYMSVGMNIRDAACYMCWAFARAYNPNDLQPFVQEISAALLIVAVFDREINCRRAASAAFQESVGRLGNFPHGIEISTTIDFFSVGLRQNSYLNLSDFIAQFPAYVRALIDHLVERKVNHWDVAIRELTAKALHKLTHRDAGYMMNIVLPKLFAKTNSIDINTRHGCVLAIGEITLALMQLEASELIGPQGVLSKHVLTDLNELLSRFLVRDLFRGMSGEMMKQCCADYIKNCSMARIETTPQCLESWQEIIDKCLVNKTSAIREAAIAAFAELCRAYYVTPERAICNAEIINSYLKGADNDLEEHIRMGYISALGVLPRELILPHLEKILDSLVKHSLTPLQAVIGGESHSIEHENIQTYKWSEARRDSVRALCNLVHTVGYDARLEASFANAKHFTKVLECLLRALDEYTLDNRGDIGAWVREAAMNAIYQIITTCPKSLLTPQHVHNIVIRFLQQSVEKIDRTRGLAGRLFCDLIHVTPPIPHIQCHARLLEIFPQDSSSVLWLFADHTFPLFCKLLELPQYSRRVLLGLSASIGQLTESLIKYSSTALFQFLRSHPAEVPRLCNEIVEIFEENLLNERVTYPMLSFLNILMGSGTINAVLSDETNTFAENIYRLVNLEIKGYKKLYKLTSSIGVYCQLLQVPRMSKRILSKMSIFLGLQHVHVRKTTATKLYETLALHGDTCEDITEEKLDEILNLLTETDWGLPLVEVRPIRNELCRLMGIKAPVSGLAAAAATKSVN